MEAVSKDRNIIISTLNVRCGKYEPVTEDTFFKVTVYGVEYCVQPGYRNGSLRIHINGSATMTVHPFASNAIEIAMERE
jgi:hypothetical protein